MRTRAFCLRFRRTLATSATAAAQAALRRARVVCFDVDSTVITCEVGYDGGADASFSSRLLFFDRAPPAMTQAIDEFAAFSGKKSEVAALTAQGAL
jgi:hypothetical protein